MTTNPRAAMLPVFARHNLVNAEGDVARQAVLLEGSWPGAAAERAGRSLDETIDRRWAWIEEEASRMAERLGPPPEPAPVEAGPPRGVCQAWLDALALRYALLKWLRVIAYFTEVRPLGPYDRVELTVAGRRDEDYVELIERLCRQARSHFRVRRIGKDRVPRPAFPANRRWRRLAERVAGCFSPRGGLRRADRVVLCGNPRILSPVAAELLGREAGLWWLYDRFAVASWLCWRPAGVGQLVCDSSLGRSDRLPVARPPSLFFRDLDLSAIAERWLSQRRGDCGGRFTRLLEQVDAHFARVRPTAVLLDEDATPTARAVAAMARRHGVRSHVVQHGAPCGRFGFAPLAADRFFAWGESSARRLRQWGVSTTHIEITGSPWHDQLHQALAPVRNRRAKRAGAGLGPQILLLTTVPPRDGRPDMVTHRLTGRTYAEMLRIALASVAKLPAARLIVKLHPRTGRDPLVESMLKRFPSVRGRVVRRGRLSEWLAGSDCVLSCLSSAGVDATLAGVPVIQLLPQESVDVLPHDDWGMVGTARTESQLEEMLGRVIGPDYVGSKQPASRVFGDFRRSAAARIADAVLSRETAEIPAPHFVAPPMPRINTAVDGASMTSPMAERG